MARKLGLDRLLPPRPSRLGKLILAMVVARVVEPAAKLATARQLSAATAAHSLGAVLDLGRRSTRTSSTGRSTCWQAQPKIETALARRHLKDGCLVLYDLTSSYLEGRLLRAGASRLQPRRQAGQAADRLRAAVRRRRLPGGGRSV